MSELTEVRWTVTYQTGEGWQASLTLAGHDREAVMAAARQALYDLRKTSPSPEPATVATTPAPAIGNGNGHTAPATNGNGNGHAPSWCAIHGVPMTQHESGGQVWYSHKTGDGTWCRGKAAKVGAQ